MPPATDPPARPLAPAAAPPTGRDGGGLRVLMVDFNAYFAGVEQQLRPELRGRPVAVAAVEAAHTACIAASYEAKRCGVKTGTPVGEARRLCPSITILVARPPVYIRFHHALVKAVGSCLPVAAVESIDEMYGRLIGAEQTESRAVEIARNVKRAVREQVGECLTCSVGLAPNRFLAKIGTNMQKPDGLVVIRPGDLPGVLHRLELTDLPGIARRMEARLHARGIRTVEQLCAQSEASLHGAWGGVVGRMWWHWLRGLEWHRPPTRRASVGHSHVLPPAFRSEEGARAVMVRLVHKAAARLRFIGYYARRMTVYVSFTYREQGWSCDVDLGLTQSTRLMVLAFADLWRRRPLGTPTQVAVTLHGLVPRGCATLPLFAEEWRDAACDRVLDEANTRFGPHAVYFAAMMGARDTAPARIAFTHIPALDPAYGG